MVLGKGKNSKDSNKNKITPPIVSEFDPEDNEKQKDDESLQIDDEKDDKDKVSKTSDEIKIEKELEQFNQTIGFLEDTLIGINRNIDESRQSPTFVEPNFLINDHQRPPRSDSQSQTIPLYRPFHHYVEIRGTPSEGAAAAVPNYRHIMLKQQQPEKK